MQCAACSTENLPTARFCGGCGAVLEGAAPARTCTGCRAPIPAGAKFCNQCGAPVQGTRGYDEGKERRIVTVLFADVSGFTSLAERLDPEEVEERIRSCWARLTPVIERHGGYVDKYMGDAVMALFGAPVAHEDDPERAVRCALALHHALRDDRLRLRVGVHTGEVIVGSVSTRGDRDYTAMGDTVNTASRLHTHTQPGRTVVSAATLRLVEGRFAARRLEPLIAKGKTEPIACAEVLGEAPKVAGSGSAGPFIGRESELARLDGLLAKARKDCVLVPVTLTAPPGVGKARLVHEWRQRVAREWPEATFLAGESVPYGGEPCRAVRAALLAFYGEEADPAEFVRALAADLAAAEGAADLSAGFIARLFGLDAGTRARQIDPRDARAAAFASLVRLLVGLSRKGPVVLALGELQWADSATVDFIDHLVAARPAAPIVLVAAGRPEALHDRPGLAALERIELPPLTPDATRRLARALLSGRDIPGDLETLLLERTDGNAFFLEEMLRSLVEDGTLVEDSEVSIEDSGVAVRPGGALRLARPLSEIRVPQTVQGVLTSRVDMLSEEARKVLKAAAVIGRTFTRSLLERVIGRPVDAELDEIIRREMIAERAGTVEREYAFCHPLIPEVASREILRRPRKALHLDIARALEERLGPRRPIEALNAAAAHYAQADVRDRSVALYLEAADRARQLYANSEAIAAYDRVLAMEDRWEALKGRAEVYAHLGRHADALADQRRLREVAALTGDRVRAREAAQGAALALAALERYEDAEREAREIAEEARAAGDRVNEAAALNTLGVICARRQRDGEAAEAWKQCEQAAREAGDRRKQASSTNNLGLLAMRRGDLAEATRLLEGSLAIEREIGNRPGVIGSMIALAEVRSKQGRDDLAVDTYRDAIRLAKEIGLMYALGICLNNLASIHARSHRMDEALATYNQALALKREMGDRSGVATTLANCAITRQVLGDLAGAASTLEAALSQAKVQRQTRVIAAVLEARGNLAWVLGDFAAAERDHAESIVIDPSRAASDTSLLRALALHELGRAAEAQEIASRLAPDIRLIFRASTGEAEAIDQVLSRDPNEDQTGVLWCDIAAAARRTAAAPRIRALLATYEKRRMAGILWRVRADLAVLTESREEASRARAEVEVLTKGLPPGRKALLEAHPSLARMHAAGL